MRSRLVSPRIHVVFLLHDSIYLRNFEDGIARLLRSGHRMTIVYPETHAAKQPKHFQRRISKKRGVGIRFAPSVSADQWQSLKQFIRSARSYLFHHRRAVQARINAKTPESIRRFLEGPWVRPWPRLVDFICRVLEFSIPASQQLKRLIADLNPDVMIIAPYIGQSALYQVDYAKAAQDLGVPVGVALFNWNDLMSEGPIHVRPDLLFVWNRTQLKQAVSLHKMSTWRISIIGSMRFSKFFGAVPRLPQTEFCQRLGLDPSRPLITYLGSSSTIAPQEHEFLWRWVEALRSSKDSRLRECNIYVRPHPANRAIRDHWPDRAPDRVVLWDRQGDDMHGIIESIGQSIAIVGIDPTAMFEAAAMDIPVLTVLDDPRAGNAERIDCLLNSLGDLPTVANTFDDHVNQLGALLDGDHRFAEKSRKFSQAFLRPPSPYDLPAKAFSETVERLARTKQSKPFGGFSARAILRPAAAYFARRLRTKEAAAAKAATSSAAANNIAPRTPRLDAPRFSLQDMNIIETADPHGTIFHVTEYADRVFRLIRQDFGDFYLGLLEQKTLATLIEDGLVETCRADKDGPNGELVLEHKKLLINLPCEWSRAATHKAALFFLNLNKSLIRTGLFSYDSHAFNIVFDKNRPIFIDWGSLIENPGYISPEWVREFFAYFMFPLAYFAMGGGDAYRSLLKDDENPGITANHFKQLFTTLLKEHARHRRRRRGAAFVANLRQNRQSLCLGS